MVVFTPLSTTSWLYLRVVDCIFVRKSLYREIHLNKQRTIGSTISATLASERGRFTVLTGARQVGKSTLVKMLFPEIPLLSFDALSERDIYSRFSPEDWITRYPSVILDEVQKAPAIFDTLKACYDRNPSLRYILLGSSQVLLLKSVRETLAGRVALKKLFPFTIPELIGESLEPHATFWTKALQCKTQSDFSNFSKSISEPLLEISQESSLSHKMWDYYLTWGGMPALLNDTFSDYDRSMWLKDYHELYLQRDLSDLARLSDLEPFTRLQKIAALRTAQTIQFAQIGAAAGVNAQTAKRYLQYLEISYQIFLLSPWFANTEKRLIKSQKLHFLDPGIRRGILKRTGAIDGDEFESAVFSEAYKQAQNSDSPVEFYYLRTTDGREVDILIEMENGYIAIECKLSDNTNKNDARHFSGLKEILDKPILLGLVVSMDKEVKRFQFEDCDYPILSVPAWVLFGNRL